MSHFLLLIPRRSSNLPPVLRLQCSGKEEDIDVAACIKEQMKSDAPFDSLEKDPERVLAAALSLLQQKRDDATVGKIAERISKLDLGGKVSLVRCCHLCATLVRKSEGKICNSQAMTRLKEYVATHCQSLKQEEFSGFSRECYEAIFPAVLHNWYLRLFWEGGIFYSKSWSDCVAANSLHVFPEFPMVSRLTDSKEISKLVKKVLVEDFWQMHWYSYPALPDDPEEAASRLIEWATSTDEFKELNDQAREMKADACSHAFKALQKWLATRPAEELIQSQPTAQRSFLLFPIA